MKKILVIGITLLIVACGKNESGNKSTAKESKPAAAKTDSNKTTVASTSSKSADKARKKSAKKSARKNKKATTKKKTTTAKLDTIREKTATGKIIAPDTRSDNPLLAMRDRDAFKYLLLGSKGQCDKKLRYSRDACDKYVKQVMKKDERWFHIISHYKIRDKHFQDQRVYQRMRYELTRNKSVKLKSMREDYGLNRKKEEVTAKKSSAKGDADSDLDTPYLH